MRTKKATPAIQIALVAGALLTMTSACAPEIPGDTIPYDPGVLTQAIIGGDYADPGSNPWIVSLQIQGNTQTCGGSLLGTDWVLTAAHCVDEGVAPNEITAVLGQWFAGNPSEVAHLAPPTQERAIREIIVHPDHGDGTYHSHDMALLRLDRPAVLNTWVQPIRPAIDADGPGLDAKIAGWGKHDYHSAKLDAPFLIEAWAPIQSTDTCNALEHVNAFHLCIGDAQSGVCNGDSGGPVAIPRDTGAFELGGVISRGSQGCNYYSLATRVTRELDFIRHHVVDVAALAAVL